MRNLNKFISLEFLSWWGGVADLFFAPSATGQLKDSLKKMITIYNIPIL